MFRGMKRWSPHISPKPTESQYQLTWQNNMKALDLAPESEGGSLCMALLYRYELWFTSFRLLPLHLHWADAIIQSDFQPFMNTFTHRWRSPPCTEKASSSEAVRVRCLALGHLDHDTQLGGAGGWTSNLSVTDQSTLHPEQSRHYTILLGIKLEI